METINNILIYVGINNNNGKDIKHVVFNFDMPTIPEPEYPPLKSADFS